MRQVILLRGINLGPRNRIAMPDLRRAFESAGYGDVATYLQSGNVIVRSEAPEQALAAASHKLIAENFGLDIAVVVRTRDELAEVIRRNPFKDVAVNPKRYLVNFLSAEPDPEARERIGAFATANERIAHDGRELYVWVPDGVARSKLWSKLAAGALGVTTTARNWSTVTSLLEMASE